MANEFLNSGQSLVLAFCIEISKFTELRILMDSICRVG